MRSVAGVAFLTVLLAGISMAEGEKPRCNAKTQGRFWPEQANEQPRLARQYAQNGELEICVLGTWRYRWQYATVHVKRLGKKAKPSSGTAEAQGGN